MPTNPSLLFSGVIGFMLHRPLAEFQFVQIGGKHALYRFAERTNTTQDADSKENTKCARRTNLANGNCPCQFVRHCQSVGIEIQRRRVSTLAVLCSSLDPKKFRIKVSSWRISQPEFLFHLRR